MIIRAEIEITDEEEKVLVAILSEASEALKRLSYGAKKYILGNYLPSNLIARLIEHGPRDTAFRDNLYEWAKNYGP